jgi:PPM family protein phosphatase
VTIEVAHDSATGRRQENQDRLVHFESRFGTAFVLADGMGGHRGGAVASQMAVSQCPAILDSLQEKLSPAEALKQMIEQVNRLIFDQSQGEDAQRGMGSTLVALLISETEDGLLAIGAHVGDSRLYFMRQGRLFRLTEDHTLVQQMVKDGTLSEADAQGHPHSNVLTRSLGRRPEIEVDLTSWMLLQPGDVLMLCSDGLHGYVHDDQLAGILACEAASGESVRDLVQLAFRNGTEDNVSVLVVKVLTESSGLDWSAGR